MCKNFTVPHKFSPSPSQKKMEEQKELTEKQTADFIEQETMLADFRFTNIMKHLMDNGITPVHEELFYLVMNDSLPIETLVAFVQTTMNGPVSEVCVREAKRVITVYCEDKFKELKCNKLPIVTMLLHYACVLSEILRIKKRLPNSSASNETIRKHLNQGMINGPDVIPNMMKKMNVTEIVYIGFSFRLNQDGKLMKPFMKYDVSKNVKWHFLNMKALMMRRLFERLVPFLHTYTYDNILIVLREYEKLFLASSSSGKIKRFYPEEEGEGEEGLFGCMDLSCYEHLPILCELCKKECTNRCKNCLAIVYCTKECQKKQFIDDHEYVCQNGWWNDFIKNPKKKVGTV